MLKLFLGHGFQTERMYLVLILDK